MNNNELVSRAITYIGKAWKEDDLSVEKVAAQAGFSTAYFNRIFAAETGRPVMDYVREYRLIRAAHILRQSDRSILDIALDLGYANPENFTRAFKRRYDMAPADYRDAYRDRALKWKDASTGTVIRRFEAAFPEYARVDIDEFADALFAANPLRYGFNVWFTTQIDCAAYKLGDIDAYILVEEYRPDEVRLTLFCPEEDIPRHIGMAKGLPRSAVCVVAGPEYTPPKDNYGYRFGALREDFAYLQETVEIEMPKGCTVRMLTEGDVDAVERLSRCTSPVISRVFGQSMNHGNFGGTLFFGLFIENVLSAVAMPTVEAGRGVRNCDIGGIFIPGELETEENIRALWASVIAYCLENGLTPTSGTVDADDEGIGGVTCEKMGYTRTARRATFSDTEGMA